MAILVTWHFVVVKLRSRRMSDEELFERFDAGTLPAADFHHREHVRVAFLYLCRYPALEALERFAIALKRFAVAAGKPGLYHATITWAFLMLIRERLAAVGEECQPSWTAFSNANPDLLDWKENILKKYYREETLASPQARATFVLPDKLASESTRPKTKNSNRKKSSHGNGI
jgi:hypothetical protein